MMGHQLGGLTALSASAGDKRIKAIATIDPWFTPYNREVMLGKFNIKDPRQAVCIVESEGYAAEIDWKVEGLNSQNDDIEKFLADSLNTAKQERVCIKNQNSAHQTDHILLDPLLVNLLKNGTLPFTNQGKLYMLNIQLILKFLYAQKCITNPDPAHLSTICT